MSKAETKPKPTPATFETLAELYGLIISNEFIDGHEDFCFVPIVRHERVPVPQNLPSITGQSSSGEPVTFFLVPADSDLAHEDSGPASADSISPRVTHSQ